MKIKDIKRLDIHPGEILVVEIKEEIKPEELEVMMRDLRENLPAGIKTMILSPNVSLKVVKEK